MIRITLIILLSCLTTLATQAQQWKYLDSLERYVLNKEGWDVHWHIIDAGDYGHPKHWACLELADGLLEAEQYEKALRFYKLSSDTFYGPRTYCGIGLDIEKINQLMRYAECYIGMKQTDTAIALLIPYAIYDLAEEPEVQEKLKEVLLLKYSKDKIREEMMEAIKTITITGDSVGYRGDIMLFGHKVDIAFVHKEHLLENYHIELSPATEAARKELMEVKLPAIFAEWYRASSGYKLLTTL